jgi:uncharacterized damage-inducible protein DinB
MSRRSSDSFDILTRHNTWALWMLQVYRFTIAAAIVHVTNHGMHHRAQCLHMLKRLGVSPLPELDEIYWQTLGEPEMTRRLT